MDITERTVRRSVRVKMAPRVITCWARARVRPGGLVPTAHENVPKASSVSHVLRHVNVVMVTGSRVTL